MLRAGPHNSICGPGPGQVCTTAAGPGRAWASNHVCGPGLGLDFRPVQGPNAHTHNAHTHNAHTHNAHTHNAHTHTYRTHTPHTHAPHTHTIKVVQLAVQLVGHTSKKSQDTSDFASHCCNRMCKSRIGFYSRTRGCFITNSTDATPFALFANFPERQPLHCDVIVGKQ